MADPWLVHRQALLQRRRCPHCAERVPARTLLRGGTCPQCGSLLRLPGSADHAAEVLSAIKAGWRKARLPVYAGVLASTFLAGWVPLLSTVVTAAAMVTANVLLVRRPLRWLPPVQRMVTRASSRIWLVVLTLVSLALNTVAAPLIAAMGAGAVLSAMAGLGATFLYIEGSLAMIERGVARAARPSPFTEPAREATEGTG